MSPTLMSVQATCDTNLNEALHARNSAINTRTSASPYLIFACFSTKPPDSIWLSTVSVS